MRRCAVSRESGISALGGEATMRWVAATLVWQLEEMNLRKFGQMMGRAHGSSTTTAGDSKSSCKCGLAVR